MQKIALFLANMPANGKTVMDAGLTKSAWTNLSDMAYCARPLKLTMPNVNVETSELMIKKFDRCDDPVYNMDSFKTQKERIAEAAARKRKREEDFLKRHRQREQRQLEFSGRKKQVSLQKARRLHGRTLNLGHKLGSADW